MRVNAVIESRSAGSTVSAVISASTWMLSEYVCWPLTLATVMAGKDLRERVRADAQQRQQQQTTRARTFGCGSWRVLHDERRLGRRRARRGEAGLRLGATLNTPAGLTAISSSSPRACTSNSRSFGPSDKAASTLSGPLPRAPSPNGMRFATYAAAKMKPTTSARLRIIVERFATSTPGAANAASGDAAAHAPAIAMGESRVIPSATPRASRGSRRRAVGSRTSR